MAKQLDPWAEHFRAALVKKTREPKGAGWLTREEFQTKTGLKIGPATKYLREQLAIGRLEKFRGSQMNGSKSPVPQAWYRPRSSNAGRRTAG